MKYKTLALTISLILSSQMANANPAGGQVVHGSATFSNPSVNVLSVTNSNNAIINWQSFNIGAGQTTNFIQPSSASSVLNRVISNNPSQLLGKLNSNGKVFLINQHGILVGAGAQINTAGFFGSTLNMTDSDYLNGNLKFEGDSSAGISNQGYIHAGDNGNIVLIAPNIENGGVIEVDNGNIILAAGKSITISSLENPAIQFEVTGNENTVTNLGKILANQGSASLFAGTLKHSGSIRAGGLVQNADGSISLVAKNSNQVSGSVDASAAQGGYIEILGDTVNIDEGANINASGDTAGGKILIGGDQQGLNPDVQNARSTTIAANARVNADANTIGNGGKVIVFAKNDVHVHGAVTAKGGSSGGNGGFIETSGLKSLDITSVPDASAANGAAGDWLIDPDNITISSGADSLITGTSDFTTLGNGAVLNFSTIETALNAGTNVTISTGTAGSSLSELGDINILSSITTTSLTNVSLTLNAHNDIIFNATSAGTDINISATGSGALNLVLNPGLTDGTGQAKFEVQGSVAVVNVNLDTNGGNLLVNGDTSISGNGALSLIDTKWDIQQGATVNMIGFAPVTLNLDTNSSLFNAGDINMDNAAIAGSGIFENKGNIILNGFSSSLSTIDTASLSFNNYGWIEIGDLNSLTLSGGSLDLQPGSGLNGNGSITSDVILNGGVIFAGDGTYSFDALSINGKLTINSGVVYSILSEVEGPFASQIRVNTVTDGLTINGGDLILNWESSSDPTLATSGDLFSVVNCFSTGCLNTTASGFDNVINPITTTGGLVDYGVSFVDEVTYKIGTLDTSNIVNWTGFSTLNPTDWNDSANWDTGVVPGTSSDVFISDGNGPAIIDITSLAAVRGLQAHAQIKVGSGGSLDIAGNAFILNPMDVEGGLAISASDAKVTRSGAGVLYNLGATLKLDQGTLAADAVNWGEIQTSVGTPFQIDGNLVNNALFALDANTGTNTFTGTGSIDNKGIMSWANGAKLSLSGGVSLSSASSNAQFLGSGLLSLNNTSTFAVDIKPLVYDTTINWELVDSVVSGIQNMPALPTSVTMSGNSEIQGEGAFVIPNTFTVDGGSFHGINLQNPLVANVQSSVQLLPTKTLTLNNANLIIGSMASLGGDGGLVVSSNSSLTYDGGLIQIPKISLLGSLITNNLLSYSGNLDWNGGTISGTGLETSGVVDLFNGTLNTDWTITPTGVVNWSSPGYASLDVNNAIITNQGEFNISSYVDVNVTSQTLAAKNFSTSTNASFINEGLLIIDSNPDNDPTTADVITFNEPNLSFINDAGTIVIKSGTLEILDSNGVAQDLVLDQVGDSLQGNGTFNGTVRNILGTVSPGKSDVTAGIFKTGSLNITGDYIQQVDGNLIIKMDSTANGLVHDQLNVDGELNAGGGIKFAIINGKTPVELALLLDQSFKPLSYASFANRFDRVDIPLGLNFTFSDTGVISITSDSLVLNEISNQLETLFNNEELNHPQLVKAMKFIDRAESILTSDEEDDERKRAPRLVCR
jgi:filamentous hemagglutinin family protein